MNITGIAAPHISSHEHWIEAQRGGAIGDGFVELFLVAPGPAAAVVCEGVPGIKADGFVVAGNGTIGLLLFRPGIAATRENCRLMGVEAERFLVILEGHVEFLL